MSTSIVRVSGASDFRRIEALVLDAVQSPVTRTMYAKALGDLGVGEQRNRKPA